MFLTNDAQPRLRGIRQELCRPALEVADALSWAALRWGPLFRL